MTVVFGKDGKVLKTGKGRGGSAQITPLSRLERRRLPFLPKAVMRNYRNTRALLQAGSAAVASLRRNSY